MKCALLILLLVGLASTCKICKLNTYSPSKQKIYSYFPLDTTRLEFGIRAKQDAHILLSNEDSWESRPSYEFVLGYNKNKETLLRRDGVQVASYKGAVFDPKTFRRFIVEIDSEQGSISLLTNVNTVLIRYKDPVFIKTTVLGLAAYDNQLVEFHYDCGLLRCSSC